jgi:hypothetical protein
MTVLLIIHYSKLVPGTSSCRTPDSGGSTTPALRGLRLSQLSHCSLRFIARFSFGTPPLRGSCRRSRLKRCHRKTYPVSPPHPAPARHLPLKGKARKFPSRGGVARSDGVVAYDGAPGSLRRFADATRACFACLSGKNIPLSLFIPSMGILKGLYSAGTVVALLR